MDDDESEAPRRLPPAKLSKTSSWVMLGFVLGAVFVWAYQSGTERPVPALSPRMTEWPKAVQPLPSPLTTIEAVFAAFGDRATWFNEITEVAMWRSETGAFSEFYEIRRVGEVFYFRSIAQLTRRVIRHGAPVPAEVPLQFTETEEQYREWYEHGRAERPDGTRRQPTLLGPVPVPAGERIPGVQTPPMQREAVPAPPKLDAPPKT